MIYLNTFSWRKSIPNIIRTPILKALAHYPELKGKFIEFRLKKMKSASVMKAQPRFSTLFQLLDDRKYIILINPSIKLGARSMAIEELPEEVLVGWIGHELGHVMDYEQRSAFGMLQFGLGYLFSKSFVKGAEKRADEIAVSHGLGAEIVKTKEFILNHAEMPERYKKRIKRLYLSPEEIMQIIEGEKSVETVMS